MASGTFNNGSSANCGLVIEWSSTKQNGGSKVSATLKAQNYNNAYFSAYVYGGYGLTINGDKTTGSGKALSGSINGSVNLISHSVTVSYTGSKSITISGYANFSGVTNLKNQTISKTVDLDNVGTKPTMGNVLTPTTTVVSEKTTSFTVTWNKATSYNGSCIYGIACSVNGGAYEWKYPSTTINTTSYTWKIGTPTQGSTYQFIVAAKNNVGWSQNQYSGKVRINKLSAPTIGDIPTYNPYKNSTLSVDLSGGGQTNKGNIVRLCDLYYGNTLIASCKGYDNTPWNNTSQTISYAASNYAAKIGTKAYTSDNFKIVAWCENVNRSRSSTVSKYFTVNLNTDQGAIPSFSGFTLSGGAFSYPSTCFISGISNLIVSSATATPNRAPSGTTITYTTSVTGMPNKSGQTVNFGSLSAGKKTITVTATDSRGLSNSISKDIQFQSYAPPSIKNYTAVRSNDVPTSVIIKYALYYTDIFPYDQGIDKPGAALNSISVQQYSTDNSTWNTASNGCTIIGLSAEKVFTVYLRIADKVKTSTYTVATNKVPTMKTNVAIRKWGVGLNCVPQSTYALAVNGNSKFSGTVEVGDSFKLSNQGRVTSDLYVDGKLHSPNGIIINNSRPTSLNDFYADCGLRYMLSTASTKTGKTPTDAGVLDLAWDNDKWDIQLGVEKEKLYTRAGSNGKGDWSAWQTYLPVDKLYPVGAVYITFNNVNPQTFLGGTWVRFGEGRTLIGQGTGSDGTSSMTFDGQSNGGKYKTTHSHNTSFGWDANNFYAASPSGKGNKDYSRTSTVSNGYALTNVSIKTVTSSKVQWTEDSTQSIVQPYVTVYFWRRTA